MTDSPLSKLRDFLTELRRRKVYRAGAIYAVLAAGGLELASVLLPATRIPEWFDELFLGFAIVGLPLVLALAWSFDVTESGIERTPDRPHRPEPMPAGDSGVPASVPVDTAPDPLAVAVLPFENLSGTEAAQPFAVGLHDDLLTELSRASALTVISRTSVKSYGDTTKSIRQIARELGVGTIVEGGVQQAGSRVRLNVQLIDARTDGHLWAERYDRELTADNIFELQSELAARIMSALQATLTPAEQSRDRVRPTGDLEAWRLYASGREIGMDRSHDGFRAAARLYERAIERDSGYALAWAGLGDALVGVADYGHVSEQDAVDLLRRGREACERALALDPALAEAHSALGRFHTAVRDAPASLRSHRRAIELRPGYAGGHQWSCWASLLLGEGRDAVDFGIQATRLDPLDPEAAGNLAAAYLMVGDCARALEEADRSLAHHPSFEWTAWVRALALQALGRGPEASAAMSRLSDRWVRGWREVLAFVVDGRDGGPAVAERLRSLDVPFKQALIEAAVGELDAAFEGIRAAWPLPWDETLYLYMHRGAPLDAMRADPRFAPLVRDVVESWRHPIQ